MPSASGSDPGEAALAGGKWEEARSAFVAALSHEETANARFGLAYALWWLGDNDGSVAECTRAYALYRRSGDLEHAVQCALWLSVVYKANFANFAAANGWIGRADRMLAQLDPSPLHGFAWVARGYRMPDLAAAEELTRRAIDLARTADDVDLELGALSQLGLIQVRQGHTAEGFALIDEAVAAALAGEGSSLETVVYTCCDMLNACELASDVERAAQWCQAADDFVRTYGCPFLYAECRIAYGAVLTAKGRWSDAERELDTGLRITSTACPALHVRALHGLAHLRVRQGRLEEAGQLLAHVSSSVEAEADASLAGAALALARGDAVAASRALEHRLELLEGQRTQLCNTLDVVVEAATMAGDVELAAGAATRLSEIAAATSGQHLAALSQRALGRVALARGDHDAAVSLLGAALEVWSTLDLPFDAARTRFDFSRALAPGHPDRAVDHARRAFVVFDQLGATIDADRVAAYLRSMGAVPRTGAKGVGVLTTREQEVLRLLSAGMSNPEIAARLHISRKTASHHVSSILAKLNLRNRAEAAAHAVATLGPTPPSSARR